MKTRGEPPHIFVERPSWDDVWMDTAKLVASRSLCSRAQVGAVIVTADNQIAAASYNGPAKFFPHMGRPCTEWCERGRTGETNPLYDNCPASHAESNALARADFSRLTDATIYVSSACCYSCAKLILQTGIKRVVHLVAETDVHRGPDVVEQFLRDHARIVERWPC